MTGRDTVDKRQGKSLSSDRRRGRDIPAGDELDPQQFDESENIKSYSGVGKLLTAERQRQQLTLSDVSNILRIQPDYLIALEEGQTADLPGSTYAAGFLRTYGNFLGLDGEEIVRQFKIEGTLTFSEGHLVFPEPVEEARRPGLTLALISLIVAGAVYGVWIYIESRDLLVFERVAEPPERMVSYQNTIEMPRYKAEKRLESIVSKDIENKDGIAEISEVPRLPDYEEQVILQKTVQKLIQEDGINRTDGKLKSGEGDQSASADVSGFLANNPDRISNNHAVLQVDSEVGRNEDVANLPLKLSTLTNQEELVTNKNIIAANLPNSETEKKLSNPSNTKIRVAVAPAPISMAPDGPEQKIPGNDKARVNSATADQKLLPTSSLELSYTPQAYGTSGGEARVILQARTDSWVQIQDANNGLLLTRMLRTGDSYHAPNRTDLFLMTGNAGAIVVMIDGETLGALGPIGQVRRNINLNADQLRERIHSQITSNQ